MAQQIRVDLLQHFVVGTGIAFFCININLWWGFLACVVIAVGKEVVWDKLLKKGTFDWWDMAYTIAPAVMILLTRMNTV